MFVDTTPAGPDGTSTEAKDRTDPEVKKAPYTLIVSIFVFSIHYNQSICFVEWLVNTRQLL